MSEIANGIKDLLDLISAKDAEIARLEIYMAMVEGGQTDALLALDGRRRAAIDALSSGGK